MDTLAVTTPSNYVVTLKKSLSYRHHLDIQEVLLGDNTLKLNASDPDMQKAETEVSFRNIQSYRRKAMEFLVIKVVNPDSSEADNAYEAVLDMPVEDAEAVADKVSELTNSKKNRRPPARSLQILSLQTQTQRP